MNKIKETPHLNPFVAVEDCPICQEEAKEKEARTEEKKIDKDKFGADILLQSR